MLSKLIKVKEFVKIVAGEISAKGLFIFTIAIALTTAFLPTICDFIKYVAELLNEHFNNSRSTKFFISMVYTLATIILIRRLRGRKISQGLILFATYSIFFYLYFRWLNKLITWEYLKVGYITYFDIIGVLSVIIIVLYIRDNINCVLADKESNADCDTLINDDAITHSDEDFLNRKPFVKVFTKEVLNCDTSKSAYSIGIVAPWGNGKTSFIKLFAEEVQMNKDIEIIYFSPWHYSSKTDIISAFYRLLSEHWAVNDIELFNLVCQYSSWLIGETKSSLLLRSVHKEQPAELYEKISKMLDKRKKRIVVIIDDLDRLEGKEILDVLKIIRGSANFPNIIFIVAYDKEYIIKAVNKVHTENDDRFIDKFFQTEYHLPLYSADKIEEFVISKAKEFMSDDDFILFNEKYIKNKGFLSGVKPYEDCITNIRDAKRWINAIKIGYKLLKNEVRICDYADVALLKLHFPAIYNLLSHEYNTYLYVGDRRYKFWEEGREKRDYYFDICNTQKKNFWECDEIMCLSKRSKEKLKNILDRLVPETHMEVDEKAFANTFYTPRYFYGILQSYDISGEEFTRLVNMNHEDLKKSLSTEFIEHRSVAFINHWREYNATNDEERLRLLRMIFYVCNKGDNLFCSQDTVYHIAKGFEKDKGEVARFLRESMLENGASYYVCILINEINKDVYDWKSLISKEELNEIQLQNLQYAIEESLPIDIVLKFFWSTSKKIYYKKDNNTYEKFINNPKAVEIFKKGIIANPNKYLFNLIGTESSPMEETKEWEPYRVISEAWPDWEDFEEFVNSIPCSEECEEYKRFFAAFKEKGYKAVPFEFKHCKKKHE